jgi:hypothetical protein
MKNIQSTDKNKETTLSNTSRDLLQRHLSSFQDNNLEAVIADYTNESVLITQEASYTGPEEIKSFFTGLITHFPKQKSSFDLDKIVINDELIYIVWHGKTPSLDVPFATDTFIIKNGKILRQTFAGQLKFIN